MGRALRKLGHLDSDARYEDVDAILRSGKISARDFTTVFLNLKKRHAWQVSLLVGQWLRLRKERHAAVAASAEGTGTRLSSDEASPPPVQLPNRAHYQVMLSTCAASGKAQAAEALTEEMAARGLAVGGRELSTLVLAHERAGDWARTAELLETLEAMEIPPLSDSSAHADEEASAALVAPSDSPKAVDNLAFAFAAAIRAHDAAGRWQAALQLFERATMHRISDGHCYCAALGACRHGNESTLALELMDRARKDERMDVDGAMYTMAMAACNAGGDFEACLRLLDERRSVAGAKVDLYAYSVAMSACVGAKAWERALGLLDEMEAFEACRANTIAWNKAMVTCNRAGQPAASLSLFEQMRGGGAPLSDHSIAAALVACRALDDWQRARAIFDGSGSSSGMCYSALLEALAHSEQWPLVLQYFDQMRKEGSQPNAQCYERAIEACDRLASDRALVLFAEMRASGL